MNWYFLKIADDFVNYLNSVGALPEVINYVSSITDQKIRNFFTGILRKNPKISLEELKNIQVKQNQPKEQNTQDEINSVQKFISRFPDDKKQMVKKWALINLRKYRTEAELSGKNGFKERYYQTIKNDMSNPNNGIYIKDWLISTGVNLNSYSYPEVLQASGKWHEEASKVGEGKEYKESNVVYGPQWKNPKYNGWTIQEVKTSNDLEVEGNKCNHCVGDGGYHVELEKGTLRIFSLRDPQNQPHVTIESNPDITEFNQVQGNSNSDPKPEYKEIVKEWVESLGHPVYGTEGLFDHARSVEQYNDALDNISSNSMGLSYPAPSWEDLIENILSNHKNTYRRSENKYFGDITDSPYSIVNAAIKYGKNEFSNLIRIASELRQKQEEFLHGHWESNWNDYPGKPDPEDYEDNKDYQSSLQKWEDKAMEAEGNAQYEWMKEYAPFALPNDILKYVQKLKDTKQIPDDWSIH
jgi:hypothetical protein